VKLQFSLKTLVFKWMTGGALICAGVVALVAAIGTGWVLAVLIAFLAASCAAYGGWCLEHRILACPNSARQLLTLTLLGISIGLITLIQSAFWFEVPGVYGPVKYWSDDGNAFMAVSAVATLVTFVGLLFAIVVLGFTFNDVVESSPSSAWRQTIVPIFALAAYGLAYWMFAEYGFFPSA
jgi:hypothetical protein